MTFIEKLKEKLEDLNRKTHCAYAEQLSRDLVFEIESFPKNISLWFIHCGTGCTCCNNEDHYLGPYETKEEADNTVESLKKSKYIASQYAPEGRYYVSSKEGKLNVDGTIRYEDRVFDGFGWNKIENL